MADDLKNEDFDVNEIDVSNDEEWDKFLEEADGKRSEEAADETAPTDQEEAPTVEELPEPDIEPDAEPEAVEPEKPRRPPTDDPAQNALIKEVTSLRAQIRELKEAAEAKPKEPEPEKVLIDPLTDPDGFHAQQQADRDEILKRVEQNEQAQQQQQAFQQFAAHVGADVQRARQETPDYDAAREFARQSRATELRALVPGASEQDIQARVDQDELELAQAAVAANERPTARLMAWAAARGYQGAAQEAEKPVHSNGPSESDRARNLRPSGGGNKEPQTRVTEADVEKMSSEEWLEWMEKEERRKSA